MTRSLPSRGAPVEGSATVDACETCDGDGTIVYEDDSTSPCPACRAAEYVAWWAWATGAERASDEAVAGV